MWAGHLGAALALKRADRELDLGWLFVLLRVDVTVRFVVSRDGQIAATPRSDETGAATLGPLIERQAHRIPVAHLVGPLT